jgi:hypothetical protein
MTLIRDNRIAGTETCPCATLSTTNPIWNGLGLNPGLRSDRAATLPA